MMSALRVVGAGVGRTGTSSLKLALERLLGAPCYHGWEVFDNPEHVGVWEAAANGDLPDWNDLFAGYQATVDWPAAGFWTELVDAYPDAVVLLSVRPTAEWWRSVSSAWHTLFDVNPNFELSIKDEQRQHPAVSARHRPGQIFGAVLRARFSPNFGDERAACEAYERHNEAVRRRVPAGRLVEWTPGDGWGPICAALDLPVPKDAFPHANTTDEFRARVKLLSLS